MFVPLLVRKRIMNSLEKKGPIVIDLDMTLTKGGHSYADAAPNEAVITKLREYKEKGFDVIIYTARSMRTYSGDISKITQNTVPEIIRWLEKNNVDVDGVVVGKPWCGTNGFYVDDKAIRPDEFVDLTYEEVLELTN